MPRPVALILEYNEKPARTNQFDAGASLENLALEASF